MTGNNLNLDIININACIKSYFVNLFEILCEIEIWT